MKSLLFTCVLTVTASFCFAGTNVPETIEMLPVTVETVAGPTSVIISGGEATYYDDGARCTYNADEGTSYGPDCGADTEQ